MGTSRAVYLIEAKWSGSSELNREKLELRPEQKRRHEAFRAYLNEWRREYSSCWAEFVSRMKPVLKLQNMSPPSAGTKLARNLEYVLRALNGCGSEVKDVLLFCRLDESTPVPTVCDNFTVIIHSCPPVEGGSFISF